MRARLNDHAPKGDGAFKLSVNDFVVKACALALMRVPEVNASWTENAILRHKHADIGVAVALDFGLITPIVFAAESKGLAVISNEVKSLAERARAKKLKPQEFEGGSFAISNLGMFGIKDFTAVINPPHAAILAVGAGEARAVVRDGKIEAATDDDGHALLRSSRDRRRHRCALPAGLQDLHRRPGGNAAIVSAAGVQQCLTPRAQSQHWMARLPLKKRQRCLPSTVTTRRPATIAHCRRSVPFAPSAARSATPIAAPFTV